MVGTGTAQSSTAISIKGLEALALVLLYLQAIQEIQQQQPPKCPLRIHAMKQSFKYPETNVKALLQTAEELNAEERKVLFCLQVMLRRNAQGRKTKTLQVLQGNTVTPSQHILLS